MRLASLEPCNFHSNYDHSNVLVKSQKGFCQLVKGIHIFPVATSARHGVTDQSVGLYDWGLSSHFLNKSHQLPTDRVILVYYFMTDACQIVAEDSSLCDWVLKQSKEIMKNKNDCTPATLELVSHFR